MGIYSGSDSLIWFFLSWKKSHTLIQTGKEVSRTQKKGIKHTIPQSSENFSQERKTAALGFKEEHLQFWEEGGPLALLSI